MRISLRLAEAGALGAALQEIAQRALPLAARGVAQGANAMAQEARRLAPVDTGELKESIRAGPVTLGGGAVQGSVAATAPHAPYIEMGTRDQAPRPFLYPAYQAQRDALVQAVAAAIKEGLS